jgi:hypothetical protein
MPIAFKLIRTISVAPFSADADPNTTPPAETDIFKPEDEVPIAGLDNLVTGGHMLYGSFDVDEGATFDFASWIRNGATSTWAQLRPEVAAADNAVFTNRSVRNSDVFVQVTAVAGVVASTELKIYMTEIL